MNKNNNKKNKKMNKIKKREKKSGHLYLPPIAKDGIKSVKF